MGVEVEVGKGGSWMPLRWSFPLPSSSVSISVNQRPDCLSLRFLLRAFRPAEGERSCRYSPFLPLLIYSELRCCNMWFENQRVFYSGGWDVYVVEIWEGGERVIVAVMAGGKKLHSRTQPCPPMPTFMCNNPQSSSITPVQGEDASSAGPLELKGKTAWS